MKKLKVIVGIDKSELIKSDKMIVACGKNFKTVLNSSFGGSIRKNDISYVKENIIL